MLTKQIEKAQKKVEEQNFLIRKRVLEYDDVMNEQRRVVYQYRDEVLEGRDMGPVAREQLAEVMRRVVDEHTGSDFVEDWDIEALFTALRDIFPVSFGPERLSEVNEREELIELVTEDALAIYDRREKELGEELMRALERYLLLQIIDNRWKEHLYDMDYLREGIGLRGFAQIDPLVAYKNEAFDLFTDLMNTIWTDFSRMIFHVEVEVQGDPEAAIPQRPAPGSATTAGNVQYYGGVGTQQPSALAAAAAGGVAYEGDGGYASDPDDPRPMVQQRRVDDHETIGRNEPCWCGSGKKYKKCHGA
jgi:preprotein translocase subunit SecA